MNNKEFVNIAFDTAIKTYIDNLDKPNSFLYNSYLVVTIRVLVLIYGKLDILNPYYLNNTVIFFQNLGKYGTSTSELTLFKEDFLAFYQFEKENEKRKIKVKNPYFKKVLKYLIDMFVAKKKNGKVTYNEEEKFLELIYTTHTKNAYRISCAYLNLDNLLYTEKYYYSKLNEISMTKEIDLNNTIRAKLNLNALKMVGVNLTDLTSMSEQEIKEAEDKAYNYLKIDVESAMKEAELNRKMKDYHIYNEKITSGNGYVDILLLMSVIITTLSITLIIILNII